MSEILDISPKSQVIESLFQNNLTWPIALGELVDNAFDAGAQKVLLRFQSHPTRSLTIVDDGLGIPNLAEALALGSHRPSRYTRSGIYGIGLKEGTAWIAYEMDIETVNEGILRTAHVNWKDIRDRGFNLVVPDRTPTNKPAGTELTLRNFRPQRTQPQLNTLINDLGYRFGPALREGKQIVIVPNRPSQAQLCTAYVFPPREDVIRDDLEVNGKRARIDIGIVKPGESNPHSGMALIQGHRVIKDTDLGTKQYSTEHIAGSVELLGKWGISKNKTELADPDAEALDNAIFRRCEALFKKANDRADILELKNFTLEIEGEVNRILQKAREKREKRGGHGTHPANPNPKVRRLNVKRQQPGDELKRAAAASGIKITWIEKDDDSLGDAIMEGDRPTVRLNKNHPFLASIREDRNVHAHALAVLLLFWDEVVKQKKQAAFRYADYDFISGLARLLADFQQQHSKPANKSAEMA